MPCPECKMYVSRNTRNHHFTNEHKKDLARMSTKDILILSRGSGDKIHPNACERLKKDIFPIMKEDDIFSIIKWDRVIILQLNNDCRRYDANEQNDLIRAHAGGNRACAPLTLISFSQ